MLRLRFKEATPQLRVDGELIGGSLKNVTDVTINVDADFERTNLAGEKRGRNDLNIDGASGSFTIQPGDKVWWDVWDQIQEAERNGTPFPVIVFSMTLAYRGKPRHTLVAHDECLIKPDSLSGSGKDYVSAAWSFTARELDGV